MDNVKSNIRLLERRADHLASRLAHSPRELAYDTADKNALLWAANELRRIHGDE